ncbi:hypothetical protein MGAST_25310 [Mycobacterium gastri 'Wayne']|uniref:Uncharacterized protein n=1 Tax=Mycobacterium gastri TaxID=1777 RepID=A0A1X1VWT0_MYCGS|nr:hypothetical protein MGAST_25310 [Mycobacterium gastri 'Wayne']ORV73569.1 hypothetical protein AWC07_02155 [Mycobacterium gastri]
MPRYDRLDDIVEQGRAAARTVLAGAALCGVSPVGRARDLQAATGWPVRRRGDTSPAFRARAQSLTNS